MKRRQRKDNHKQRLCCEVQIAITSVIQLVLFLTQSAPIDVTKPPVHIEVSEVSSTISENTNGQDSLDILIYFYSQ